jgi:hypothetical protein
MHYEAFLAALQAVSPSFPQSNTAGKTGGLIL